MSNSFFQPSTFDLSDDQHQGMPNRFSAYVPANYLTEEQEKFRQAAAAVAAMHGLRRPNPNPAATTHQNPNSTVRRGSNFKTQQGVRQESRIHKPQPQHIYNNNTNNNHHHHPRSNSHGDFMVYRSQNQNHQSRNQNEYAAASALQKYSQAQAHYQFAMQQQVEHAFRLVVSSIGLPSSTYNPMLLSSQPAVATTLTMGLSGELSQQQHQQASNFVNFVNFVGHKNMNPIQPLHNPTTRTLTLQEMDDGGNQQDGLDLSLRL